MIARLGSMTEQPARGMEPTPLYSRPGVGYPSNAGAPTIGCAPRPHMQEAAAMHDGVDPWRTDDLAYLEREINYWTAGKGYAACAAGVQAARDHAARHGMARVAVLPGWSARYDGALPEIVARIDPSGFVADCGGVDVVVMPTEESLDRFVQWSRLHVTWT